VIENGIQTELDAWLSTPTAFGMHDGHVERIETHISRIYLCGDRAIKLKRAVRFPYLDFTELAARRQACEAEVAINRRTAPEIYRGVIAVRRGPDRSLTFDGDGEPVEWLVDMRRFDEAGVFSNLVGSAGFRRRRMDEVADKIAAFHGAAEICPAAGGYGGTRMIIENNAEAFEAVPPHVLEREKIENLNTVTLRQLDALKEVLEQRREGGAVRHGHGDLHLGNICIWDGQPTLFDAIEFNTDFAEIDVLYDLAFMLMDLEFRDHRRFASIAMNRYFDVTGDIAERPGSLAVLPLFLSMRAAIRAHVDAAQSTSLSDPDSRQARAAEAAKYLELALRYLAPKPPSRLIAVGGLSGSGKSRMARELGPFLNAHPAARIVRTDAVRKRLAGADQETRLGPEGYTADMHMRTYDAFYAETRQALSEGHDVIMDAVFSLPQQRAHAAEIAIEMGVDFQGLWIDAPLEVREQRVRERQNNISDVTVEITRQQMDYDLGQIDWAKIDSSGPKETTISLGKQTLGIDNSH